MTTPQRLRLPRELPILALLLAVFALLSVFNQNFLKHDNLTSVGEAAAVIGIIACGEALVILGGGLDLSVGSIVGICACTMALILDRGSAWPLAALAGIAIGAAAGLVNGFFITVRKLPPILTTLATLLLFRHGISIATHDRAFGPFPDVFNRIGVGWLPLLICAAIAAVGMIIQSRSRFGRWTMATGSNEQAAVLSAVPVARIRCAAYVASGVCAAIAGWIVMAFNNNAQSSVGKNFELDAIAACVVGGVSITGGDGSIVGAALGAVLIALLQNALILTGRAKEQYGIFTGGVILAAALIEVWRTRARARSLQAAGAHAQ